MKFQSRHFQYFEFKSRKGPQYSLSSREPLSHVTSLSITTALNLNITSYTLGKTGFINRSLWRYWPILLKCILVRYIAFLFKIRFCLFHIVIISHDLLVFSYVEANKYSTKTCSQEDWVLFMSGCTKTSLQFDDYIQKLQPQNIFGQQKYIF